MNAKQTVIQKIKRTKLGRRFIQEQRFRAVFSAAVGLLANIMYAIYHGALGVVNHSLWVVTMFTYYMILSSMRFSAVLCEWKRKSLASEDTEYFVAKLCGGLLVLLSFILGGIVYISLSQNVAVKHHEIVMITIATYTFYKITVAVIRAIKQRKNTVPLLVVIRTIGYAEVAASLPCTPLSVQPAVQCSGSRQSPPKKRPNRSPAQRVRLGKEKQGSKRSFRR